MIYNLGSNGNVYLTGMDGQDQDIYGFVRSPVTLLVYGGQSLTRLQDYQADPEYSTYPIGCELQYPAQSSSDWTFSPPAMSSPCIESPLSTPEVHQDSSWNPLDQPNDVGSLVPPANSYLSCPPNANLSTNRSSNIEGGTQPFVSLVAINDTSIFDDIEDDQETPKLGADQRSLPPSPTTNYQPNWGSGSTRRSPTSSSPSKTVTNSKRRKSSDKEARPLSRSKSESTSRLRSTRTSRSTTFPATAPAESPSLSSSSYEASKGSRTSHNQVEKQYRNRLNGQFETLLQTLPKDLERDGADQRVSKAEVLVLARRHILQLETEKKVLEEKRSELEGDVVELKRRFVGIGGICMP